MDHIQTKTNIQDLVYAHAHDFVSVHMWKPVWCRSHWVFISRINCRRLTCGSFQLTHITWRPRCSIVHSCHQSGCKFLLSNLSIRSAIQVLFHCSLQWFRIAGRFAFSSAWVLLIAVDSSRGLPVARTQTQGTMKQARNSIDEFSMYMYRFYRPLTNIHQIPGLPGKDMHAQTVHGYQTAFSHCSWHCTPSLDPLCSVVAHSILPT